MIVLPAGVKVHLATVVRNLDYLFSSIISIGGILAVNELGAAIVGTST
jgi:hypothetical protein